MARLALFALLAVVACASAFAYPPPGPHGPPAHGLAHGAPAHGLHAWLHAKKLELSKWGHAEAAKLKGAWKQKVVPHIVELEKKFGAEWQKKAPTYAALLKKKAGIYFDKAVQFVSKQVDKKLH